MYSLTSSIQIPFPVFETHLVADGHRHEVVPGLIQRNLSLLELFQGIRRLLVHVQPLMAHQDLQEVARRRLVQGRRLAQERIERCWDRRSGLLQVRLEQEVHERGLWIDRGHVHSWTFAACLLEISGCPEP